MGRQFVALTNIPDPYLAEAGKRATRDYTSFEPFKCRSEVPDRSTAKKMRVIFALAIRTESGHGRPSKAAH